MLRQVVGAQYRHAVLDGHDRDPHRLNGNDQKRSSGGRRASARRTRKMPSWATSTAHGSCARPLASRVGITRDEGARECRSDLRLSSTRLLVSTRRSSSSACVDARRSLVQRLTTGRVARRRCSPPRRQLRCPALAHDASAGPPTRPARSRSVPAPRSARWRLAERRRSRAPFAPPVRSGECQIADGGPAGMGSGVCASRRRVASPTRSACRSPRAESGGFARPWKRPSATNVDSPWRTRTSVASGRPEWARRQPRVAAPTELTA